MNEYTLQYQNYEVGGHLSFSNRITPTITDAIKKGMYTVQFFMGNPKSYDRQIIEVNDILKSKTLLQRFPMNVISHFPYIANLNGSVDSIAWENDHYINTKTLHMLKQLEYELSVLSNFKDYGKCGVVIHPGCYPDKHKGLETIAESINKINFTDGSLLFLENCAGEGRKLCKDFEEISVIFDNIKVDNLKNVGVCVDTAHIFGNGQYDIRTCKGIDQMFKDFDSHLGLDRFSLLHLNDSKVEFGSKKDRHENIGDGFIWKDNLKTLKYLLENCKRYNIPMVLETCDIPKDLNLLSTL